MKKCIYCGKEYQDETDVFAIDGEPLQAIGSPIFPKMKQIIIRKILADILACALLTLGAGCATTSSTGAFKPTASEEKSLDFPALDLPSEEITVECEAIDKLGRRASIRTAFDLPKGVKDASGPVLLAMVNLSPIQSNLVSAVAGIAFTDATATGSVFDNYGKTVASVMLKKESAFRRGSIALTVYRTTGLEAGVVMLRREEHKTVFDYYVRPGFNHTAPFMRAANAKEAFSQLVWKRPASPP